VKIDEVAAYTLAAFAVIAMIIIAWNTFRAKRCSNCGTTLRNNICRRCGRKVKKR